MATTLTRYTTVVEKIPIQQLRAMATSDEHFVVLLRIANMFGVVK